ncbi:hypothetical protein D1632_15450 [Chryseobacterium nematophagum]|uniref:Uncharacterized protein n=1 Tax=Chryseobacterium nematophagum TaxID=2305228 RepID=A0A3M7L9R0_9FLAO|nr:hypothetical protein [Chryseobacterium nematophagum]RMZ58959.1 hypothetical protein D1632_15450 [Chryseobacterium nematophagum]
MYTIDDLIKAGKSQVRNTADLMTAYIGLFKEKFGREPDCAGCTFNNDWNRLITYSNQKNQKIMLDPNITFQLRDKSKIYSYDFQHKNGRMIRTRVYGHMMSEEFAEKYLTEGNERQLQERKAEFKILPIKFIEEENLSNDILSKNTLKELQQLATEKKYPEDEWKKLKKEELIVFLEAKELEV